ncbi:MAG TPA: beta-propeller fold lactonase family protein [Chthoniobacterales bacterium]|jgi:DNA-binding beta-propeller fold protein YncE|nr:beta-propeller fold lactonase family protein [Chthoniobacterales bacterium]
MIKIKLAVSVISAALSLAASTAGAATGAQDTRRVYVMSNKPTNSVLVFDRASNGSLTFRQEIGTKGEGTGVTLDPFMSQGALAMNPDGTVLVAVNAASGEITAFTVTDNGLAFGSKLPSGGDFPVSATIYNGAVYVLNQLGIPNITGFRVNDAGQLSLIPSSKRALAGGALALPAEVSFTPDGTQIIVTEKGTQLLDIFNVLSNGLTDGPVAQRSSGKTPFGFAFGPSSSVIISEVENRLPLKATTSSYLLTGTGKLQPVSATVPDNGTAACWVAVTGDVAWVVNTGTATISSYQIGAGGNLTLLNPAAASTGAGSTPIDAAASSDGAYLYDLLSATGEIAVFAINGGNLTPLSTVSGLPLSIQGIVVR